ncbi:MAG: nucleotidyltransferase domain-containing protein [Methylibium sp.]|uniref:nucleotidyltransferase family protein n=1 Tax=Methylibium sp. TaxID=2067992 RepID=UPI00184071DC|nr:nucleotidyltransferase domain-containing protein [Methylibium sp.]MBA3596111.1 nucleotidyltransferase domain-containing protein [Methylibium sp.]
MRLNPQQTRLVRDCVRHHLGPKTRVWLFGSRVDESKRGGDVDLYVEPQQPVELLSELKCRVALKDGLDLNVDLVVGSAGTPSPIASIAKRTGVPL